MIHKNLEGRVAVVGQPLPQAPPEVGAAVKYAAASWRLSASPAIRKGRAPGGFLDAVLVRAGFGAAPIRIA
ncbi:MAG: hypothetical protein OXI93_05405 [Bryobacterales bacterium]|nr:hypothetical protein [Bryobacterales bacterium]